MVNVILDLLLRVFGLAMFGAGAFATATGSWSDGALMLILGFLAGMSADIIEIKERLK